MTKKRKIKSTLSGEPKPQFVRAVLAAALGIVVAVGLGGVARADVVIEPSGDTTGVADADAIENALRDVAPGGTVKLAAGHFYVSESIVIEGFNGTLQGADKDVTIVEAVRGPNGEGFAGCPPEKLRPCLFTRVYVQSPDHNKPSQMWALSRKQPQETAILS